MTERSVEQVLKLTLWTLSWYGYRTQMYG